MLPGKESYQGKLLVIICGVNWAFNKGSQMAFSLGPQKRHASNSGWLMRLLKASSLSLPMRLETTDPLFYGVEYHFSVYEIKVILNIFNQGKGSVQLKWIILLKVS